MGYIYNSGQVAGANIVNNAELCIRSAVDQASPYEGPWRHFGYKGLD
jgi:hypothetical protein